MPVFLSELFGLYESGGDSAALPRARPYGDYLRWLAGQDREAALAAWKQYLAGVEEATRVAPALERASAGPAPEQWQSELSVELTGRLQALGRDHAFQYRGSAFKSRRAAGRCSILPRASVEAANRRIVAVPRRYS